METKRIDELMNSMKAFGKATYHRSELLDEMLALQQEMVSLTFNDEHASMADLKIYDVERHLEQLNEERNHVADAELEDFEERSKILCNLIKAEISGLKGESKAFKSLEYLRCENVVMKNIELKDGDLRTEIDALVITPKSLTIVEVKNTAKDIFIDEEGHYYRTGEFLRWDCNIAEKMSIKEQLLRKVLLGTIFENVEIQKVVVFTNNHIEVQNKYLGIHTCFVSQLHYVIEGFRNYPTYTSVDMVSIKETIESASGRETYPFDFDTDQYKRSFATLMNKLETATAIEEADLDEEQIDNPVEANTVSFLEVMKRALNSKYAKYAGSAAAGFAVAVVSGIVINSSLKR